MLYPPDYLDKSLRGKPTAGLWYYFARLKAMRAAHPENALVQKRWKEVRDFLFEHHWDDADKIARNYIRKNMPAYSLVGSDDLGQGVARGLLGCIDDYDPRIGTTFMQYANAKRSRLRGAVIDTLRELQYFPRDVAQARRVMTPLFAKLAKKLGHRVSIEEFLLEYGEKSPDGKFNYKKILTDPKSLYFSGVFNQSRKGAFSSSEGTDTPEEIAMEVEDKHQPGVYGVCGMQRADAMTQILSVIKDEDIRFAVWMYYWGGETNGEIAKSLGCSPSVAAAKHAEGKAILKQNYTLEQFKAFMPQREIEE